MTESITLRDVAEQAGVSIGTASQALNNRPNVAPETRARVLDVAVTLGYPIKSNPPPKQRPFEIIGLVTKHDIGLPFTVNPFYSHVQIGVENECRKHNISLMFAHVEVNPSNHPVKWPVMLNENRVEGLILAGAFIENTIETLKRKLDIPVVLVDSYSPGPIYDSVLIENEAGAAKAVKHLIALGHTQIGLIGSHPNSPRGIWERRKGYLKTLRQHGITETYIEDSELSVDSGYQAAKRLLKRTPEVTAIFTCNDLSAFGVLNAARELNLNVPKDLSLVGFDNIDLAKSAYPALTTVHVHKSWLGILGVRQLIARSKSPEQPKTTITLATQLIERNSTCAPPT